ncbi:hypothetical protein D9615_008475 [Tricholomella constricta]|uniref:Uncharacterized protein n=1 Tax=Tricholomella constricta TaxID=117010 RepID=A0A8H5H413_9AGAR|nr:hypothetical protein D9615_008475 [Tricholomella constricta]
MSILNAIKEQWQNVDPVIQDEYRSGRRGGKNATVSDTKHTIKVLHINRNISSEQQLSGDPNTVQLLGDEQPEGPLDVEVGSMDYYSMAFLSESAQSAAATSSEDPVLQATAPSDHDACLVEVINIDRSTDLLVPRK